MSMSESSSEESVVSPKKKSNKPVKVAKPVKKLGKREMKILLGVKTHKFDDLIWKDVFQIVLVEGKGWNGLLNHVVSIQDRKGYILDNLSYEEESKYTETMTSTLEAYLAFSMGADAYSVPEGKRIQANSLALQWACSESNTTMVRYALNQKSINLNYSVGQVLNYACLNGSVDIVKLLLQDKRLDPTIDTHTSPILVAAMNSHPNILALLLEDGRVDPALHKNEALADVLTFRYDLENTEVIVDLLLNDTRVSSTFSKDLGTSIAYVFLTNTMNQAKLHLFRKLVNDTRIVPPLDLAANNNALIKGVKLIKKDTIRAEMVGILLNNPDVVAKLSKRRLEYYQDMLGG